MIFLLTSVQVRSGRLAVGLVSADKRFGGHTGGQALLELVGLVRVLQDQGVQVALAPDLELGLAGLLALLDPGVCKVRAGFAFMLFFLFFFSSFLRFSFFVFRYSFFVFRFSFLVFRSSFFVLRCLCFRLSRHNSLHYLPDASSRRQISMNYKKRSAFR